jgi:uncharacterized protein (TIGR02145 family)
MKIFTLTKLGRTLLVAMALVTVLVGSAAAQQIGTVTDSRDGQTYKTVKIGDQTWMAENLNYQYQPQYGRSWCYDQNCESGSGKLYDYKTAKKACMSGWHLPSRWEWDILVRAAGGKKEAGKKLKARSGWNDHKGKSGNGTDDFGFSAMSGHIGKVSGNFKSGEYGEWWTATEFTGNDSYYRRMHYTDDSVSESYSSNGTGFSVRCVADN